MRQYVTIRIIGVLFGLLVVAFPAAAQIPGLSVPAATSQKTESSDASSSNPSLDDLIKILENDQTRTKLIESLKAAAYKAPASEENSEQAAPASSLERTVPGEFAIATRALVGSLGKTWLSFEEDLQASSQMLSGAGKIDVPDVLKAILPVGLVAIVVFVVLAGTRLIKAPIFRRMATAAEQSGPLNKLFLLIVSTIIDALSILLSWAAGTVAATIFFGGRPGINQTLFLNAFFAIEMIKVGLAGFAAPNYPQLRLTPFSNRQASYWSFWLSRLISIIGYSFMFVAPIVQTASSLSAANSVRFIVVVFALVLSIGLILKNRGVVRERLKRARKQGDTSFGAYVNAFLGQIWWVLAIAFVISLFVVWVRSPQDGFAFMTAATLKSIAAMAVGGLLVSVLSRMIHAGIPIPQAVKDRLPLLERRINSFIPNVLTLIRVVVVIVVIAIIMEAWDLVVSSAWLEGESGRRIVGSLLSAAAILIFGAALYIGVSSWIEYRMNPNYGTVPTARERTLLSLFRNAFTITIVVLVAMLVLSQIGIDIAPLLAGAGVVGLAIGFGAQKFVQDIITGAFIQIQNAMNVGDVVAVNGVSGVVEQLTVRSVGLRALDGTWYLIPFSSVDQVANYSKDFAYYVADVGVAYRENVDDVKQMMFDAFDELKDSVVGENIIGGFDMWGVNELGDSAVVVRGRMMTKPSTQWGVGRAYREIVKRMSDERGIEIPFPHMTVWFGEDRQGSAPPVRLAGSLREMNRVSRPASSIEAVEDVDDKTDGRVRVAKEPGNFGTSDASGRVIPPDETDIDSTGGGRG